MPAERGLLPLFSFGENITPDLVNYRGNYPYAGGEKGIDRKQTVGVKSLPCNAWGLFQMHGNVWEWCADWYGAYDTERIVNPFGSSKAEPRVCRGGSWIFYGGHVRSANRYWSAPDYRINYLGVRFAVKDGNYGKDGS